MASGINPEITELLDNPKERMDAARDALVEMGAIDCRLDTVILTPLGKALDRLPVELPMGKAIVEAAGDTLRCSVAVATIAAMSQALEDRAVLFEGDRPEQVRDVQGLVEGGPPGGGGVWNARCRWSHHQDPVRDL